jgi:beta-glucosidase
MIKFPEGFLWGAATSAYQVEGGNSNSDWWPWEKQAGKENSGFACRHYDYFEQDFALAGSLQHNAHRFSIEWSRIEPEEGKFSEKEIKHYVDVVLSLKAHRIEPIVTLHHFTNPVWFGRSGGWEDKKSIARFSRYCDFVVRALAPHVSYWVTINEPTVYISHAFIFGVWPPQGKSFLRAKKVQDNLAVAHIRSYSLIHNIYKELGLSKPLAGFSQFTQAFVPCTERRRDRFAAALRNSWFNLGFIDYVARHRAMDFIGVNYYSRQLVELKKCGIGNLVWDTCQNNHRPLPKNSLGWDIYPEGLSGILMHLKKYGLPVIITENGICTSDDNQRWEYLAAHLKNIHMAMEKGVLVKGYLYWSLMDNFEWDKGFGPRFGLIDVDYRTYLRTVRESAKKFAQVCRTNTLEE